MKKYSLFLVLIFFVSFIQAQRDSLKKIRFSGIQFDIGPATYPEYRQQNIEDYKKVIKNDPYLNADLSSYTKQQWYMYSTTFNGIASLKFYAEINDGKKLRKEFYIGLKYGEEGNAGINYYKQARDTVGVYTEASTGKKLYEISTKESNYNYGFKSEKLIVPLGFNFTTDKSKFFWISMGVELAPVINFGYVFTSARSDIYTNSIIKEGDTLNSRYNYTNNHFNRDQYTTENRTKFKSVGYGLYASLPFTMYLHPFKKKAFLKHINLLASLSPLYMYSYNKNFGSASGFNMSLAVGIRYNW